VALRAVHSMARLSYNNVLHRFLIYAASNATLIALWALFFIARRPGLLAEQRTYLLENLVRDP
jgi:hypothetical protein